MTTAGAILVGAKLSKAIVALICFAPFCLAPLIVFTRRVPQSVLMSRASPAVERDGFKERILNIMSIPRIFHRIWLGSEPMPSVFMDYEASWRHFHPDWKFRLWTENNRPVLENEREFLLADTYAAQANVLRYEILCRYGGIYLDTDFECLRDLSPLIEGISSFVGALDDGFINNAIIGSVPGHPFAHDLVRCLPGYHLANWKQANATKTGCHYVDRLVKTLHPEVNIFDSPYFYPYSHVDKHFHRKPFVVEEHPQAYAVHHWEMSWTR